MMNERPRRARFTPRTWWLVGFGMMSFFFPEVSAGETLLKGLDVWQLCNECSGECLSIDHGSHGVYANGSLDDNDCRTDFNVFSAGFGLVRIQHSLTRRFICFSGRARLTTKLDGRGSRCAFIEHMDEQHYTQLESVHFRGTFLGFNRKGRFLSKKTARKNQGRCFKFNKFQRRVSEAERRTCCERERRCRVDRALAEGEEEKVANAQPDPIPNLQEQLHRITHESLMDRIRAKNNDLLGPPPTTLPPPPEYSQERLLEAIFHSNIHPNSYQSPFLKFDDSSSDNSLPSHTEPRIEERSRRRKKKKTEEGELTAVTGYIMRVEATLARI